MLKQRVSVRWRPSRSERVFIASLAHVKAERELYDMGATYIGAGCFRRAYRFGNLVVKGFTENTSFYITDEFLLLNACRLLRGRIVKIEEPEDGEWKYWQVQPVCNPVNNEPNAIIQTIANDIMANRDAATERGLADIHWGNLMVYRGSLVLIDW